jgi:probable rRNA maturation factor
MAAGRSKQSRRQTATEMTTTNIHIEIANQQVVLPIDASRIEQAVRVVLAEEGVGEASLSVAIVDDAAIHALNRRHLGHDDPTDVLSFLLDSRPGAIEGEVIVSAETAAATAPRYGWPAESELLLYLIHGVLHLVGYDDLQPDAAAVMRAREEHCLRQLGLELAPRGRDEVDQLADHCPAPRNQGPSEGPRRASARQATAVGDAHCRGQGP